MKKLLMVFLGLIMGILWGWSWLRIIKRKVVRIKGRNRWSRRMYDWI